MGLAIPLLWSHSSLGMRLNNKVDAGQGCAKLPDLDTRAPEEILGFNQFGLPS